MRQRDADNLLALSRLLVDPSATAERLGKLAEADASATEKIKQYQQLARDNAARAKALDEREVELAAREREFAGRSQRLAEAETLHHSRMAGEQADIDRQRAMYNQKMAEGNAALEAARKELEQQVMQLASDRAAFERFAQELDRREHALDERQASLIKREQDMNERLRRMREVVGA